MDSGLLEEMERRKLLPSEDVELLNEMRKRKLIGQRAEGTQPPQEPVPIPEPTLPREAVPPEWEPPISRGTMQAVGGTAGALVGSPANVPGLLAGGAVGAAAGSGLYDFNRALSQKLFGQRNQPPLESETDFLGPTKKALGAAGEDVVWSMGGMAVGPAVKATVKPVLGKVFGVFNPTAKQMFDQARKFNVNLGTSHVSPRKWVRGVPQVMGVFPFVGTPFRREQARVVGELDRASARILNELAPTSTLFESAEGMTKAAARRFKWNSRIGAAYYEKFYRLAGRLPEGMKEIVPSAPIKDALEKIAITAEREATELTTGAMLKKTTADPVGEFIEQLKYLPDRITVGSARGLERTLNEIVSEGTKQGWDLSRLGTVKKGLEAAKNLAADPNNLKALGIPEAQAAEIMGAWNRANSFWHRMLKPFESATGKKFGRADRNIFNKAVWKPGSKEADEIFKDVFSTKSLDAVQNLREIVGPKEFRRATAKYLDNAVQSSRITAKEGSIVDELFSAAKFEKEIGLNTKEGRAVVEEMLKGTPLKIETLDEFVKVASRILNAFCCPGSLEDS